MILKNAMRFVNENENIDRCQFIENDSYYQ